MSNKNVKNDRLLLNEVAMLSLFHLRALAKSSLGALIVFLRDTEGEFTEWIEANKETLLSEVPAFKDYCEKLNSSK